MKIIQRIIILHLLFAICLINELFACDIAVVSAGASSSGRPFIWKNRDYQLSAREEITYTKARKNDVGASLRVIGEPLIS